MLFQILKISKKWKHWSRAMKAHFCLALFHFHFPFSIVTCSQARNQYWLSKGALDIQKCCHKTTYFFNNKVVSFLSKADRVTNSISIWLENFPAQHLAGSIRSMTSMRWASVQVLETVLGLWDCEMEMVRWWDGDNNNCGNIHKVSNGDDNHYRWVSHVWKAFWLPGHGQKGQALLAVPQQQQLMMYRSQHGER